jgi:hypothetical protein
VTVGGVQSNTKQINVVAAASITSVTPNPASIGQSITVKGNHFLTGTNSGLSSYAQFFPTGGNPMCSPPDSFNSSNGTNNTITIPVPTSALTGKLDVRADWIDGSPFNFTLSGNAAPIAFAGKDQVVPVGSTAILNGTPSYDFNSVPLPLTYQWSISSAPSGSNAVISNPTSPLASFVPDVAGGYYIALTVSNGSFSSSSTTFVTTSAQSDAIPNPGRDQTVQVGSTVQLDASGSVDFGGVPIPTPLVRSQTLTRSTPSACRSPRPARLRTTSCSAASGTTPALARTTSERATTTRQLAGSGTRDPVEGKKCCGMSWNPYIYVKQNPVNEVDPTGRDSAEYASLSFNAWKEQLELRLVSYQARVSLCVADLLEMWIILGFQPTMSGLEVQQAVETRVQLITP